MCIKKSINQFSKNNKKFMKKGHSPITRVKNSEPNINDPDWVIWAVWTDLITFVDIEKKTGKTKSEVIKIMLRSIKPISFRL